MTRSDFEQWALTNYPDSSFERYESGFHAGKYKSVATQCRWEGYQGARVEAEPVAWRRVSWGANEWIYTDIPPSEEIAWDPLFAPPQPAKAVPEGLSELVELVCAEMTHRAWRTADNRDRVLRLMGDMRAMLSTQELKE